MNSDAAFLNQAPNDLQEWADAAFQNLNWGTREALHAFKGLSALLFLAAPLP